MNINVEKKKKVKTKRWIFLIIPVVFVIIFLAFCFKTEIAGLFAENESPAEDKETTEVSVDTAAISHEDPCNIVDRDMNELYSVMIQPVNDEAYTLAYIDGEMYLDGDIDFPVKQSISSGIKAYATEIHAQELVTDTPESSANQPGSDIYGLKSPSYYVEITYTDGVRITLSFGNYLEKDGCSLYYMCTDKSNCVYLVTADFYDAFTYKKIALHPVNPPEIDTTLIDSISVTGENDFTVVYQKGNWEVTKPISYPADGNKIESLLRRINDLKFYAYVGEKSDLHLDDYGLTEPRLSVDIIMSDMIVSGYDTDNTFLSVRQAGMTHHLLIGDDYNDVTFYCMYDNTVYIGTYFTVGFWFDVAADDLYLLNPVNFPTNSLKSLTVNCKDSIVRYTFDYVEHAQGSKSSSNIAGLDETVYDIIVCKDGELIDANDFFGWYSQLTAVSVSGKLRTDMTWTGKEPDITVQIETQDANRRIDLVQADPLNYAVLVNGNALYYVNMSKINILAEIP